MVGDARLLSPELIALIQDGGQVREIWAPAGPVWHRLLRAGGATILVGRCGTLVTEPGGGLLISCAVDGDDVCPGRECQACAASGNPYR